MKEGLKYFSDIQYAIVGLLLFFVLFLLVCIWVYKIQAKESYQSLAYLPLKDEEASNE